MHGGSTLWYVPEVSDYHVCATITVTSGQDAECQKYIYSSVIGAQSKKHTKVIKFQQTLNVLTL
jgi:hypothetical protein